MTKSALIQIASIAVFALASAHCFPAQTSIRSQSPHPMPSSLTSENPGLAFLFDLEAKFAKATAEGGGAAFASFFADDAVTLSNGKAPVTGQAAIATGTTWSPEDYQLIWTPTGGQMAPCGDMGFTWGHYEGTAKESNGNPVVTNGRYMTIWRKQPDGTWKVVLDSSNNEPPDAGDCCKIP